MEQEVASILLNEATEAEKFEVTYLGFKIRLSIKPLNVAQLIKISREISKIKEVNEESAMFPALMAGVSDLRYIIKSIAIATDFKFPFIIERAIAKLPLQDIETLFKIVKKQCDMSKFFFIIISAKGQMNLLKAQVK